MLKAFIAMSILLIPSASMVRGGDTLPSNELSSEIITEMQACFDTIDLGKVCSKDDLYMLARQQINRVLRDDYRSPRAHAYSKTIDSTEDFDMRKNMYVHFVDIMKDQCGAFVEQKWIEIEPLLTLPQGIHDEIQACLDAIDVHGVVSKSDLVSLVHSHGNKDLHDAGLYPHVHDYVRKHDGTFMVMHFMRMLNAKANAFIDTKWAEIESAQSAIN